MLLTGTFVRSLDEKQRFSLPKPLRDALGFPDTRLLYLTPGTDHSLNAYPEEAFTHLAGQLESASPTGANVRAFSRLFFAQAQRVELDKQGRVRIPTELAVLAGLGADVVLLGVRDHLELWNRSEWENYLEEMVPHYDELAERALAGEEAKPATESELASPTRPTGSHPK